LRLIENRPCVGYIPLEEDDHFENFFDLFEYRKAFGTRNDHFMIEALRK